MKFLKITLVFFIFFLPYFVQAQLGETYDIERPKKYEEKKIGYEKTFTKKYALPRRFLQNTTSHYNYFFNANEKLKLVIEKAKETQKDTFDRLLNYFNYSLEDTKTQITDLDSVMQKATGGILIHDLRSNWVDNFYLLIGKSYFLKKQFDSAEMTFNYINYQYATKTKDKERVLTGSNSNDLSGNNIFSISTKEKKGIVSKVFERPPSRNEAFLWMIRTYIEEEDYGSAAGLIQTLKNDPVFPKRLHNDLDELTGFLYYKQNAFDSAAHYVILALSTNEGKNDKARREFLAGQLYELSNNLTQASNYYAQSAKHTLDPVMEVYARLNSIKIKKSDDPKIVEENIAALLKMARKDAYTDYRDIIYYFVAKMEIERNQINNAKNYYSKSTTYATNNVAQKNKSFLALADIAYNEKQYKDASNYYDSIALNDGSLKNIETITARKTVLKNLVSLIDIVNQEDSLQNVAKMPIQEREDYIKKLLKRLRKENGLKEDVSFGSTTPNFPDRNPPTNLFEPNNGEWYFYNNSIKTRGYNDFKKQWGTRPNIDGWRIAASLNQVNLKPNQIASIANTKTATLDLTFDGLTANLPLSDSLRKLSNDTIKSAMLIMAKLYQYDLEDTKQAILTYEDLIKRFPNNEKLDEVYYNLYLAYKKIGDEQKANQIKKILDTKFQGNTYTNNINNIGNKNTSSEATTVYNKIYNLFLEGKFEDALEQKKLADAKFNQNEWSQQLLYIEAIYYIKLREDSTAMLTIDKTINVNATTPLAAKAIKLRDVLARRVSIENELKTLQITRNEDAPIVINTTPLVQNNTTPTVTVPIKNTATKPIATTVPPKAKDTLVTVIKPKTVPAKYIYKGDTANQLYAVIVLNKVDNIFTNEARNAFIVNNRSYVKSLNVNVTALTADTKMLVIGEFKTTTETLAYLKTVQPKLATEIIPWLAKEKYSIMVISEENFTLLQTSKDISSYNNYINELFPGKF
jgi:tetratricopeptide (TPR) repeat protein